VFVVFDLFRPAVGRARTDVGVQDRPAAPTAKRPEVLDVNAARRMDALTAQRDRLRACALMKAAARRTAVGAADQGRTATGR
jgi:hypothetical protein